MNWKKILGRIGMAAPNQYDNPWDQLKGDLSEGYLSEAEEELVDNLHNDYLNLKEGYIQKEKKIAELEKTLKSITDESIQEKYWNEKYSAKQIKYQRREIDGLYQIDVRNFYMLNDLPQVSGNNDDIIAINCLKWVMRNITYTPDKTVYGYDEYWAYPYQTLKRRKGDCDDGAILMASMMVANGVPYWKVRINAGTVYNKHGQVAGGHAYVTYYCDRAKRWVAMDWCFYPVTTMPWAREDYKESGIYGNGEVWFSFNTKYAFAKHATDVKKMENIK